MRYALIDNGIVSNIIELNETNAGDFSNAIKTDTRPVAIGDSYIDEKFYRDNKEILTPAEEIEKYLAALQTLGVNTEEVVDNEN